MRPLVLLLMLVATLSAGAQRTLVVAADGSAPFRTVQTAFDAVPLHNRKPVTIHIRPGVYKEKLRLDSTKRFVTLIGEDAFTTVLTFDDHTGRISPRGDTINTYTSASFFAEASDFRARNITFDNSAGYSAGQAVAIQILGDRVQFEGCRFTGNQDVLFPARPATRQYFAHCYIEGTTDFIFGPSTAWFEQCHINSKRNSHVTAASTPQEQAFGYVFNRCILTTDSTVLTKVSLGRPWRPYASVTYLRCYMGGHILPEGWNNWRNPANEKTARFAEFASFGPGAQPAARAPWIRQLNAAAARIITLKAVFGDWDPLKGKW
ncbi:pectinesterase family protein [Flaviaesturariibacter amylovorans]|uniref:Pectinesterase n=1 Tax=Flaviaesturariibacter amylovorans TaxID=1084520 RepID=A0ABP8GCK9_9BACT